MEENTDPYRHLFKKSSCKPVFCDCTNKYYLIQHKDGGLNFLFAEVE